MTSTQLCLYLSIVDHGLGEAVVEVTKAAGSQGGTILLGRGTAEAKWLELLGLGDVRREVILTIAPAVMKKAFKEALRQSHRLRKCRGIAIELPIDALIRHLNVNVCETQGEDMSAFTHELISVIVNSGFADDVMSAARKAGAKGGTIINARGTGKEEDVRFFGLTLVPEKELLLIIARREECEAIMKAILETPCLKQPGMGIAFCSPVTDFMPLGDK